MAKEYRKMECIEVEEELRNKSYLKSKVVRVRSQSFQIILVDKDL